MENSGILYRLYKRLPSSGECQKKSFPAWNTTHEGIMCGTPNPGKKSRSHRLFLFFTVAIFAMSALWLPIWPINFICGTNITHVVTVCGAEILGQKVRGRGYTGCSIFLTCPLCGSMPPCQYDQFVSYVAVGFNHGLLWCVKYMARGTPGTTKPDCEAGGFCGDRRPKGHVFHTSRQAMIKTYYSTSIRIKYGTKL